MTELSPMQRLDLAPSINAVCCEENAVSCFYLDAVTDDEDRMVPVSCPVGGIAENLGCVFQSAETPFNNTKTATRRCLGVSQLSREPIGLNCLNDLSRRRKSTSSTCGVPQCASHRPRSLPMGYTQLACKVCGVSSSRHSSFETHRPKVNSSRRRRDGALSSSQEKAYVGNREETSMNSSSSENVTSNRCCEGLLEIRNCCGYDFAEGLHPYDTATSRHLQKCTVYRTLSQSPPCCARAEDRAKSTRCRHFQQCFKSSRYFYPVPDRRRRPKVHDLTLARDEFLRKDIRWRLTLCWIIALVTCLAKIGRIFFRKISRNGFTSNFILAIMWTAIILPGQSRRVYGNSLLVSPHEFCSRTRFLSARQQEICQNQSRLLKYVEDGVLLGSRRCQTEFQHNRWNCTHLPKMYYGRLLNQDVRETAYLNAVTSAAITYKVTMACSKGGLPECACGNDAVTSYDLLKQEAQKRNLKVNDSDIWRVAESFDWGGCGDKIDFGYQISRLFMDNFGRKYQSSDLKSLVEMHNFEAGRLAIKKHMKRECKCHGITGSCTLETCWNRMPKWLEVGENLRERFDNSIRVHLGNDGRTILPTRKQKFNEVQRLYPKMPYVDNEIQRRYRRSGATRESDDRANVISDSLSQEERRRKKRYRRTRRDRRRRGGGRKIVLSDEDLIFTQDSPNFCKRSKRSGSVGTSGRVCNPYITGAGSCDHLCCGRSYAQRKVTVTKKCNCRFEYCCQVICDKCTTQETIYICN